MLASFPRLVQPDVWFVHVSPAVGKSSSPSVSFFVKQEVGNIKGKLLSRHHLIAFFLYVVRSLINGFWWLMMLIYFFVARIVCVLEIVSDYFFHKKTYFFSQLLVNLILVLEQN